MRKMLVLLLLLATPVQAVLYNTTNLTAANNAHEQVLALNDITRGLVGTTMLLIAFTITFLVINQNEPDNLFAPLGGASFITLFAATVFLPLGYIAFWVYKYALILLATIIAGSIYLARRG